MRAHWILLLSMGCGPLVPVGDSDSDSADSTSELDSTSGPPPVPTSTTGPSTSTSTSTSTSSSTTEATIGSAESSDEGFVFLIEPDGGGPSCLCCDVFAQDCPDGEKCVPWANDGSDEWNGTRCSPIDPTPGQVGDACTAVSSAASGMDDCDEGLLCWNVDPDSLEGTCVAMCTGSEANPLCEDPSTDCLRSNEGVLVLCLPTCDPLLDECPPAQGCIPSEDAFVCAPTRDASAAGEACESQLPYDCAPGLLCTTSMTVGLPCDRAQPYCCTPYCDLADPDPTAACLDPGQVCTSVWGLDPAPVGYENVGTCALP